MKALKKFLNILTFSQLWIALAAVAMLQSGFIYLQGVPMWNSLSLLVFFGALSVYLFIRLVAVNRIKTYQQVERWGFLFRNLIALKWITVVGFALSLVVFLYQSRLTQMLLGLPALLSVLYGLPVKRKGKRLRDIGIIKIFIISFVWAFTGSILPASCLDISWHQPTIYLLMTAQFLFIFAITLPFDIKDQQNDRLHGVSTIPMRLGNELTYTLSFICLALTAFLYQYMAVSGFDGPIDVGVPAGVCMLLTGLAVHATLRIKGELIYFFVLDGTILLQAILWWSSSWLN